MKQLNNYITEKLRISSKSQYSQVLDEDVHDFTTLLLILYKWICKKDTFRNYGKNYRIEWLRYINNDLLKLIDYYEGDFEEVFMKETKLSKDRLEYLFRKYNDILVESAKSYYKELFDKIPF